MKLLHQRDMKYKLVIFDFDGTIADTSAGILDAHRFTLQMMGKTIPCEEELRAVIGGNLLQIYINTFGFEEERAREAVRIYRERYLNAGIHMSTLYPGIRDLLRLLKSSGCKIGVATLKSEKFAKLMLNELEIFEFFDCVCGMDDKDTLSKVDLILECCSLCHVDVTETVLIGDSNNDLGGAQKAGTHFIGVTYGFGFNNNQNYCFETGESTDSIFSLIQMNN